MIDKKDTRPQWQQDLDKIVLDRMIKHGETKEQAQNAVARFIMEIIGGFGMRDWLTVVFSFLMFGLIVTILFTIGNQLDNLTLGIKAIACFCLGGIFSDALSNKVSKKIDEWEKELNRYEP